MESEDIRPIDFLPNTFISRDGRLWRNGKEKKFTIAKVGYEVVSFSNNDKTKTYYKPVSYTHLTLPTNREV